MAKVVVNPKYCKACGLCLLACKKKVLDYGKEVNEMGYFAVKPMKEDECIGCKLCAVFCPESAIEVYK